MPKTLEITTGRHPLQVAVVLACTLTAASVIITQQYPASLTAALPGRFVDIWLVLLLANGLVTLGGTFWRNALINRLMIESGGVMGLAATLSIYVVSLGIISGGRALGAAGLVAGLALGLWWRSFQIIRDVHRITVASRAAVLHTPTLLAEQPARDGDQ